MQVGDKLRNKENKNMYTIIDVFHYRNTVSKGYVLKDTWNRYSEPIIISDDKIRVEYDYKI